MPTKKARINLTVEDDMNQLLDELAILTGVPKTRLVMDFITDLKPVLLDMKKGLELAKTSRESLPAVLASMVSKANEQTAFINKEFSEMLSEKTK